MENSSPKEYLMSDQVDNQNEFQMSFGNFKAKEEVVPINDTESDSSEPIGKREMNTILSNLNSYWIEIMASLGLFIYLYIYEIAGICIACSLLSLFKLDNIESIGGTISFITQTIGLKWFTLVEVFQNLSVGFFCLTTFSGIFKESHNIKRFFIFSFIKALCYYILSIVILRLYIIRGIKDFIRDNIEESSKKYTTEEKDKLIGWFNKIMDQILIIVGNFLATYNVFLEKLIIGSLYIFLFKTPNNIRGTKKVIFRSLSIFPIIFILSSLVFRALNTIQYIKLNVFISPILLGSKVTIFGFFIITLCIIKYKSLKFNVYDSENAISPKVFKKVASKTFLTFGVIELIIGLFISKWSKFGIGSKYLLILCVPIITLYDYKKKAEVKLFCSNKKDYSKCFKAVFNIVGYFFAIIFGAIFYILLRYFVDTYISPVLEIVIENLDFILQILLYIT